jgi:hypothetical protein
MNSGGDIMVINTTKTKQTIFQVTAEFILTNKQSIIGFCSLGGHLTIEEFIESAGTFITVTDRKKKNPATVIRTDQIVTIRELDRKEISIKKLDL